MTSDEFRTIALALPGAEESSHMNHPDFRVKKKIFATLGPNEDWGMAKLTPAQQQEYLDLSTAFKPAAGKWGEGGATLITLADAPVDLVRTALHDAWQNITAK